MADIHVGERIRQLREMQNYTRETFAEKIDISVKFLYEIETGKKGFSVEILSRVSKILSVSCDYLLFGEKEDNYDYEKIRSILESMNPMQIYKIQDILHILCEICDL